MLTYVCRKDLIPGLCMDPVLHYYPLLSCYQEPRALATAWKDGDGLIQGCLLPCDPPGGAWIIASTNEVVRALLEETPPEWAVTLPLWADSVVQEVTPERGLSSQALAVCTRASLRVQPARRGLRLEPLDMAPEMDDSFTPAAAAEHLGCFVEGSLAGFCSYRKDGHGAGSVERLVVSSNWVSADLGKIILAGAAEAVLRDAERVVFAGSAENVSLLGVARTVGFRTCYWLRSASPETLSPEGLQAEGSTPEEA
jgi:hypothetical protein